MAPGNGYLDRDTLVAAAADVADRDGWAELTISKVAKEVDRHVTSLYGHVDGLDGLRHAIQVLALRELGDALWEAALGRSRVDALDAVVAVYRDYLRVHPGRSAAIMSIVPGSDPVVHELAARMTEPIYATMRSFGFEGDAVVHAQRVLSATIRGFAIAEAAGIYHTREEADETFRQVRLLFVEALTSGQWPDQSP
jgi:AcrR family transcriptional regulator